MENNLAIWIAIIGSLPGLSAIIIQIVRSKKENKKIDADITIKITEAASKMLDQLQEQIDRLEKKVYDLEVGALCNKREIVRLISGINRLIAQIRKLGEEPVWTPDIVEVEENEKIT